MSMMAPDPDDFDWSSLEFELEEPEDVVDVTSLSDVELLDLERDLVEKLRGLHQMIKSSTTDEGREIHSLRAAARIELARRNIK